MPALVTFLLTWLSYAGMYLTRKNLSAVKGVLAREGVGVCLLAGMDIAYLLLYSVSQLIMGTVVDKGYCSAKWLLVTGLVGSAMCSMGVPALITTYEWYLIPLWALNGFAQSTGWPANAKLLNGATPTAMGIWSTNYQVGGVAASFLAGYLATHYSVSAAFVVPGQVLFCVALCNAILLPNDATVNIARKGVGGMAAVTSPVIKYAVAYSGVKLVRYGLMFWLPFYLSRVHGYADDTAAYTSTLFEVGGTMGAVSIGYLSDTLPDGKSFVCSIYIAGLSCVLFVLATCEGLLPIPFALLLLGFLVNGPDALIVGPIAQQIGGPSASTVCAFINGFGSLGAVAQGYLTPFITEAYSWEALFLTFSGVAACSCVVMRVPTKVKTL